MNNIKLKEIAEMLTIKDLLEKYPTGILSVVSDTFDLWKVCTKYLPQLKEEILSRDGKLVIRPDSGDPVDILCGTPGSKEIIIIPDSESNVKMGQSLTEQTYESWILSNYYKKGHLLYKHHGKLFRLHFKEGQFNSIEYISESSSKGVIELLWDTFGGTINEQGYKVLDSHIGAIYGDSITLERANEICKRLEAKGFASTNVVLGIGSYTYQYNTRDTFGFAMKATYVEKLVGKEDMRGKFYQEKEGFEIFKDPITDSGMKKSAKGLVSVIANPLDGSPTLVDQCTWETVNSEENLLKIRYKDGKFFNTTTLTDIKNKLNGKN